MTANNEEAKIPIDVEASTTMAVNNEEEEITIEVEATSTTADNEENEIPVVVEATPLFQTTLRQKITPYLPPPVVVAMRKIDPQLEPYVGAEPSITIMGSLFLGLLLWQLFMRIGGSGGGKAIQNDDDDDDALVPKETRYFDSTLLLCGPSLAGKTCLFHALVHPGLKNLATVKSIKPNTGFVTLDDKKICRVLDAPGHWGASKMVSTVLETDDLSSPDRIVLVLDSTLPVAKAADYLYSIISHAPSDSDTTQGVLVACHKAKAPKAKNTRRIKLQLRTELERLDSLSVGKENGDTKDWEQILNSSVTFCASSCDPPILDEVRSFLQTGSVQRSSN